MKKNQAIHSDERLKENIRYIDPKDIRTSNYIPLRMFNYKEDEDKRIYYGVIAQEVERLGLTNLLEIKGDGYLGVDYISLIMLKCASYERELSNLRVECQQLKDEIEKLKNDNNKKE